MQIEKDNDKNNDISSAKYSSWQEVRAVIFRKACSNFVNWLWLWGNVWGKHSVIHRLTPQKGIHSFRYFLPECVHLNPIVSSSCVYAFQLFSGISGHSQFLILHQHFLVYAFRSDKSENNGNAYMHEEATIGLWCMHSGRKYMYLNGCTPFGGVSPWIVSTLF